MPARAGEVTKRTWTSSADRRRRGFSGTRRFVSALPLFLLQPPHLGEAAVGNHERAEGAALHDAALVHDEDLVGIHDGGEAVRDNERRAVFRDFRELRL